MTRLCRPRGQGCGGDWTDCAKQQRWSVLAWGDSEFSAATRTTGRATGRAAALGTVAQRSCRRSTRCISSSLAWPMLMTSLDSSASMVKAKTKAASQLVSGIGKDNCQIAHGGHAGKLTNASGCLARDCTLPETRKFLSHRGGLQSLFWRSCESWTVALSFVVVGGLTVNGGPWQSSRYPARATRA